MDRQWLIDTICDMLEKLDEERLRWVRAFVARLSK